MGNFIEFNWEKKYLFIITQAFLMSFRMNVNFSNNNIKNENNHAAYSMFDLITESSLSFCFFIYVIEKYRIKNLKKKISNIDVNLSNLYVNKMIKENEINIYKSSLSTIFIIFSLTLITGIFRFGFSFLNYYVCLKEIKNYKNFLDTFFSFFLMVNTLILSIIKIKISKKKFYLHNIIAIINILSITIIIVLIYYKIHFSNNDIGLKLSLFIYSSFFCWLSLFFFILELLIYKILTEKYYVNIYLINAIEGMYVIIFTIIFYFVELKKQEDNSFDFNIYHLILSCIMQIIINSLIKFIVYTYDEMHSTIPYFLQIFIDTIKSIIISKNDKNFKYNLMLIIPNLYLIFFLLVFIEIIIIKVCNMEKKTKKYLHIFEMDETIDIPNRTHSSMSINI